MQALLWPTDGKGGSYETVAIPDHHLEAARELAGHPGGAESPRTTERMMELYLDGTEPDERSLVAAIRRATIAGAVHAGHVR